MRARFLRGALLLGFALAVFGCSSSSEEASHAGTPTRAAVSSRLTVAGRPPEAPPANPAPPERVVRPVPPAADLDKDVAIEWRTPRGSGSALLPAVQRWGSDNDPSDTGRLTRLVAVFFPPDGSQVIFVGTREPDRESLSAAELLDAFSVACRSFVPRPGDVAGKNDVLVAPGVTIDPLPEQLDRGLRDGDPLSVRYFADVESTGLGWTMFEADRTLKTLAFGKDNLTKQRMSVSVEGYRNELDLVRAAGSQKKQAWHRFWIEPIDGQISRSASGAMFTLETTLAVHTRHTVPRGGKLVDSDQDASSTAKAFSAHLTEHYDEYAREIPVLGRLAVFAQLAALAKALSPYDTELPGPGPRINHPWLLEAHQPAIVVTPSVTPAVVVEHVQTEETRSGRVTQKVEQRWELSGGVTLLPKNRYRKDDPRAELLERGLLAAMERQRAARVWTFTVEGVDYRAVAAGSAPPLTVAQLDLQVGSIAILRDYQSGSPANEFGPGWSLRRPRLTVSRRRIRIGQERPAWIAVEHTPGQVVVLHRPGTVGIPDAKGSVEPVPGYLSEDGSVSLACYGNRWVYTEGKIDFRSLNGGPFTPIPGPGARYIGFSADAEHRVEELIDANRRLEYRHEGGRLRAIADAGRNSVEILADANGRISGVKASGGASVDYRYNASCQLSVVSDSGGSRIAHDYDEWSGRLVRISGDGVEFVGKTPSPAQQFEVVRTAPRPEFEHLGDLESTHVLVRIDRDGQVSINGQPHGFDGDLANSLLLFQRENVVPENLGPLREKLRSLAQAGSPDGTFKPVLVFGEAEPSVLRAFRRVFAALLPESIVQTTFHPRRAAENLRQQDTPVSSAGVMVLPDGWDDGALESLQANLAERPGDPASPVLLVVGHNSVKNAEFFREQRNASAAKGKLVVLLVCGDDRNRPDLLSTYQGVESVLADSAAMGVVSLAKRVDQGVLPELVRRLQRGLADTPRKARDIRQAIQAIADEFLGDYSRDQGLKAKLKQSVKPENISDLKFLNEHSRIFRKAAPSTAA